MNLKLVSFFFSINYHDLHCSSFLKARNKQPQVRLFTSIYDFTRIALDVYWAIR